MGQFIDLTGQRFGRLVALRRVGNGGVNARATRWLCRCDCGTEKPVAAGGLKGGKARSCGCLAREIARTGPKHSTHGQSNTPTYVSWRAMHARCRNVRHHAWARYGGRGITVCERWQVFENFLADMGERPAGTTIDRRNNNAGYTPDNCYWATKQEQNSHKADSVVIAHDGREQTLTQWARELGLSVKTLRTRRARGWPLERILQPPHAAYSNRPQARKWLDQARAA